MRKGFKEWFKSLSKLKKTLLIMGSLIFALVLIIAIYAASKFSKLNQHEIAEEDLYIKEIEVNKPVEKENDEEEDKPMEVDLGSGYTNFVLFGGDSRHGVVEGGINTDSIIIFSLNNETKEVNMVSVYRDTLVNIGDDIYAKANAAYAYGGPKQALTMLNTNLDLNISEYVTIDFNALAAAVDAYNGIQFMLARKLNPFAKYVCSVGTLHAGTTQNVVADYAKMIGTIRTFDMNVDELLIKNIEEICSRSAENFGCTFKLTTSLKCYVVYNNPHIADCVLSAAVKVVGKENIAQMPIKMSSEDFSQYLTKKPGVFIRLGTRNEKKGITTLPHNNDFMIDEDALDKGSATCVRFVLDNMDGIDAEKIEASDERKVKM